MSDMIVCMVPGPFVQAIARRVGAGKHLVRADLREENAVAAARTLSDAGHVAVDNVAALPMEAEGFFIPCSDFLMDGGSQLPIGVEGVNCRACWTIQRSGINLIHSQKSGEGAARTATTEVLC